MSVNENTKMNEKRKYANTRNGHWNRNANLAVIWATFKSSWIPYFGVFCLRLIFISCMNRCQIGHRWCKTDTLKVIYFDIHEKKNEIYFIVVVQYSKYYWLSTWDSRFLNETKEKERIKIKENKKRNINKNHSFVHRDDIE